MPKELLLDTNFLLSCALDGIDFFDLLPGMGFSLIVPTEVMTELTMLANRAKKGNDKRAAGLALRVLEANKNLYKEIKVGGRYVDIGIVHYLEEHQNATVATLDKILKKKAKRPVVVIRNHQTLEII